MCLGSRLQERLEAYRRSQDDASKRAVAEEASRKARHADERTRAQAQKERRRTELYSLNAVLHMYVMPGGVGCCPDRGSPSSVQRVVFVLEAHCLVQWHAMLAPCPALSVAGTVAQSTCIRRLHPRLPTGCIPYVCWVDQGRHLHSA